MTRLLFVTIFLLAVWTTFAIWQIAVRENLASAYAPQARQDAPQRQEDISGIRAREAGGSTELARVAHDQGNLIADVDRLVGSQQESIDRLRAVARGEGEMLMLATAYTHVATPGVADINGTGDGLASNGMPVHEGLVAVDPEVIKLGSLLYIISDYPGVTGYYVAGDTGGAIKGLRVDIFMENRSAALKFKRRVRVRIIQEGGII